MVQLTDTELRAISQAYGVTLERLAPQRSELIIDLDRQALSVSDHRVNFAGTAKDVSDEVLAQYLALVRALRSLPDDAEVILRDRDMGRLSTALAQPPDLVYQRLGQLMAYQPLELRERASRLWGRPLIPSLGILVGITSIGVLVFASPSSETELLGPPRAEAISVVASASQAAPFTVGRSSTAETAAPARATILRPEVGEQNSPDGSPAFVASESADTLAGTDGLIKFRPAAVLSPPETVPPAAPVSPTTVVPAPLAPVAPAPTLAEIRHQALALIPYPWEQMLPGWQIEVHPAKHGYLGATYSFENRIEIYYRSGQTPKEVAFTLAHEIGHAIDLTYNTDVDRARWRDARGLAADHPWFTGYGMSDFEVGAGDFAESFAVWQLGESGHQLKLAGTPDAPQLNLLHELSSLWPPLIRSSTERPRSSVDMADPS